jgi:hypothetical protein
VLLITWRIGWLRGAQLARKGYSELDPKIGDASLALMGLLLGFTFAMALGKHDRRREMVINDSNSIGDFYTCCSLLKEPQRSQLRALVRDYAEHRLNVAKLLLDEKDLEAKLVEMREMQGQMTDLVSQAVDQSTPVAVPLVNTLNEVTSSHAARLAAVRDRLPGSIVALLFLAAIVSLAEIGRQQGAAGKAQWMPTSGFILLVGFAMYITVDLNQPARGLIQVSQQPMEQLLESMGK